MGLKDEGFLFFKPDQELVELIIIEKYLRESIYQPNKDDIQRICREFDFNYDKLIELIREKLPNVHTLIIDAEIYRQNGG